MRLVKVVGVAREVSGAGINADTSPHPSEKPSAVGRGIPEGIAE